MAQVDEKTSCFRLVAIMASRRFKPFPMLFRKYFEGFSIDSPTSALAAKCMIASGWNAARVD